MTARTMTRERQHALAFGGGSPFLAAIGGVRFNRQQDAADYLVMYAWSAYPYLTPAERITWIGAFGVEGLTLPSAS